VVRVLNFFRANETVYLVMRYERGRTLQEHILARRGAIRENFIRHLFAQLLNGLREVHTGRLLHLDIKPANIYVRNDGTPVLIDFGAADTGGGRQGTGPLSQADVYAGIRAARAVPRTRRPRALERHLCRRRHHPCLPCRQGAAARGRTRRTGPLPVGHAAVGGQVFAAAA
jgi:serine/threonine protein kinase